MICANQLRKWHTDPVTQYSRLTAQVGVHLIVDGPSLADHVFYRLLAHRSPELSPFDASPSYREVGEGFLTFLCELEAHGANVDFIFFDGLLPTWKRTTRHDRQAQYLKDLYHLYVTHVTGFEPTFPADTVNLPLKHRLFLCNSRTSAKFRRPLPLAFLVPAILGTLQGSQYAARTRLVPEEADGSCARAARSSGGIILTSDSDLLVYDLGRNGAVAFLSDVQLTGDGPIGRETAFQETLKLSVWRPKDIAKKLGLPSLSRFAFEISQDQFVTLTEAVQRAKKSKETPEFQKFMREYEIDSITAEQMVSRFDDPEMTLVRCQQFDPRVSILGFLRHPPLHISKTFAASFYSLETYIFFLSAIHWLKGYRLSRLT